jgi:anhydro-N-acetylmuramic acid kinase
MEIQTYRVIGVMSGTSLDGIDLCEVEFKYDNARWFFDILRATTIPYAKDWVSILRDAHYLSRDELISLDQNYTVLLAGAVSNFMTKPEDIDLVCSHGHTVLHQPEKGLTYQIGNLPRLAKQIKKTVVCDFRTADVALGGQGAPLVPVGDRLLFSAYDYCINIGGFVNISCEKSSQRLAFDVCPANKILNLYAEKLGLDYDDKGEIAKSGACHQKLLEALNTLKFYHTSPPKSLGIEWLEQKMIPVLNQFNLSDKDMMNTLCHHIAFQISRVLEQKPSKVLITGGGAYHDYLIDCLQNIAGSLKICIPDATLLEYKEAMIFGLLGVLKYRGENNVLSSVTGAKYDHSSGKVYKV